MLSKKHVILVFMLGLAAVPLFADTIPGGDVSGTWLAQNSPYYITGNITVPSGDSLTIEPGVAVSFLGYYSMVVSGILKADGTEADSIVFAANNDWFGLLFQNAPDTSRLEYCTFEAVNAFFGLIQCVNSNPLISHCRISGNTSYEQSGGITLINSDPEISCCTISGNSGTLGGGIRCNSGSAPIISDCNLIGNRALGQYGGGISIEGGSDPVIENCIINRNRTAVQGAGISIVGGSSCTIVDCTISLDSTTGSGIDRCGGGIYMNSPGGSLAVTGSTIDSCYAWYRGGGLFIQSAARVSIRRSIFYANAASDLGGAVYCIDCDSLYLDHCDVMKNIDIASIAGIFLDGAVDLIMTNCIFRSQQRCIYFLNYSSALVSYSDFYDWGSGGPFGGSVPAGLGTLAQTNANGDSCDIYCNILMDPLFENFPNGDYHLTDSSPCIDAGDPAFPLDPDGTITDMGVYWYNQGTAVTEKPIAKFRAHIVPGATVFSGPLRLPAGKSCRIFDITGRTVEPATMKPGIYFLEIDGKISQKVIKVR